MLIVTKYHPLKLEEDLKNKIGDLHSSFFNLTREEAIRHLEKRDLVYVFSEKETGEVVGTVATKWILHENSIVLYIGNAIVSEKHQHNNFLSHVIFRSYMKTLIMHPRKTIYVACFMTSPKAYNICKRFPDHYPRPDKKAPEYVLFLMDLVAREFAGPGKYTTNGDVIITDNFKRRKFMHNPSKEIIKTYDGYFEKVNPDFVKGHQLLTMFSTPFDSILLLAWNEAYYFYKKIKKSMSK